MLKGSILPQGREFNDFVHYLSMISGNDKNYDFVSHNITSQIPNRTRESLVEEIAVGRLDMGMAWHSENLKSVLNEILPLCFISLKFACSANKVKAKE